MGEVRIDNNSRRWRSAAVLLGTGAGAFTAAAIVSAATAPAASADDFTEIINFVDADLAAGQAAFTAAFADFGSADVPDGLAQFFTGTDDDLIGVPDSLFVGTVEALTNQTIQGPFAFTVTAPADFTSALTEAQLSFAAGEMAFTAAATDFAAGDFGDAALQAALGSLFTGVGPAEDLFIGATEALGF